MSTDTTCCTFFLDKVQFGIDIGRVNEVLLDLPVTRVPLAPREVEGLIHLRGQIIIAINLRRVLLSDLEHRSPPRANIVINSPNGPYSLLADHYGDVVELDSKRSGPPCPTLDHRLRSRVRAVYQLGDSILHLLNLERIIHSQPPGSSI